MTKQMTQKKTELETEKIIPYKKTITENITTSTLDPTTRTIVNTVIKKERIEVLEPYTEKTIEDSVKENKPSETTETKKEPFDKFLKPNDLILSSEKIDYLEREILSKAPKEGEM